MLYLEAITEGPARASVPREGPNFSLSLRARVLHPNTRRHVRLLGPCFKTGRLKPLCQHPKHVTWANPDHKGVLSSSVPIAVCESEAITHPEGCHIPPTFIRRSKLMLTRQPRSTPGKPG